MPLLRNWCCPKLTVAAVKGGGFGEAGVGAEEESRSCPSVWVRDGGGGDKRPRGDGSGDGWKRGGQDGWWKGHGEGNQGLQLVSP